MIETMTLLSAFLTGLLGSVHCLGMCGGIIGALTMSLPKHRQLSSRHIWLYLLSYHSGRISSYTIAGILVNFLGTQLTSLLAPQTISKISVWVSGTFMILLGLYLGRWWQILAVLERLGHQIWCKLEPLGRGILPVRTWQQAYSIGLIWGWLPCGLTYSVLVLPLTATSVWQGGLVMLVFGFGTLPMLLMIGTTTHWFTLYVRQLIIQRLIGALIILTWFIYLGIHTIE
jgi:sulfite exporter TauE/SafE